MKISELTVGDLLNGIEKYASDLAVMAHQSGNHHLCVKIEDNEVVDYWLYESIDNYFRAEGWEQIAVFGTGSCQCNCDACSDGEDPTDWAGDEASNIEEYLGNMLELFIDQHYYD